MQEFTSVSVSSYEADSLTALLNEKSGDGWDVVAIVPTGSTVTGYLSRQATGDTTPPDDTETSAPAPEPAIAAAVLADTTLVDEPEVESDATPESPDTDDTADATDTTDTIATDDFPTLPGSEPASSPVDEPAGWATGVGTAAATEAPSDVTSEATTDTAAVGEPAGSEPAAAAATTAAAAPAGWYADPSSRYELRYWDAGQWTEHVSRAGQQFTDPPVA